MFITMVVVVFEMRKPSESNVEEDKIIKFINANLHHPIMVKLFKGKAQYMTIY